MCGHWNNVVWISKHALPMYPTNGIYFVACLLPCPYLSMYGRHLYGDAITDSKRLSMQPTSWSWRELLKLCLSVWDTLKYINGITRWNILLEWNMECKNVVANQAISKPHPIPRWVWGDDHGSLAYHNHWFSYMQLLLCVWPLMS